MKKIIKLLVFIPFISFLNATDLLPTTVGIKTVYYLDAEHGRPIIADVYYPIDNQQTGDPTAGIMVQAKQDRKSPIIPPKNSGYPLIILSHGYGGSRQHLSWFAEALSAKGYIVAAIEHFGNTAFFDIPQIALQRWLRPQDVTEFLNQFLADKNWKVLINPDQIGFAGFSLGGLTGIWILGGIADKYEKPLVGKSSLYELAMGATQEDVDGIDYEQAKLSYKDNRIKSAFLMAPAHGFSFSSDGLKNITAPVFIIVGEQDKIAPASENSEHYAKSIGSSELKILTGNVSHLAFRNKIKNDKLNCASAFEFEINPDVDVQKIHDETSELAIIFFDRTLRGNN